MPDRLPRTLPLAFVALLASVSPLAPPYAPAAAEAAERGDRGGPRFDDGAAAVFKRRCVRCHGANDQNAELRLDSYAAIMRGGEQGPAVIGGDLENSLLYQKVTRRNRPAMPPRSKLSPEDTEVIRAWIDGGALP